MKLDKTTRLQRDKILFSINESDETIFNGKSLIVCDIQPEYSNSIPFSMYEFCTWVNDNFDSFHNVIFLYNGDDTLGMITEYDLKDYYMEHGMNEEVINQSTFHDKGYGYMRACIDAGVYEDDMVLIGKYMLENNYDDIQDISEDEWELLKESGDYNDVELIQEYIDDGFNYHMITEAIKKYDNIILVGGASDECLKEVELALLILSKTFNFYHKFVY